MPIIKEQTDYYNQDLDSVLVPPTLKTPCMDFELQYNTLSIPVKTTKTFNITLGEGDLGRIVISVEADKGVSVDNYVINAKGKDIVTVKVNRGNVNLGSCSIKVSLAHVGVTKEILIN